jgi:tetratricopeptide (TPR) repeat protein
MCPKVFISHSTDDQAISDNLCTYLEARDIKCWIAPRDIPGGTSFPEKLAEGITNCELMLVLLTPASAASEYVLREVATAVELRLELLPVLLQHVTLPVGLGLLLKTKQRLDLSGRPIATCFDTMRARILELLGARAVDRKGAAPEPAFVELPPFLTAQVLVGRTADLQALDDAWDSETTNVLTMRASGGVGKSSLLGLWLGKMAADRFRGANSVFGYCFEGTAGDGFIESALQKFGDPDPTLGTPEDKGKRLATIVGKQRGLLVLDGFQAVQQQEGQIGKIVSPAIRELIIGLAHRNRGLCIIGTRLPILDIAYLAETTAPVRVLENCSREGGAAILKTLGVVGPREELERASEEVGGHALTLHLLGSYLAEIEGGDVSRRDGIKFISEDHEHGGQADRMLQAYEEHLHKDRHPALSLLRIVSLFIGPVEPEAIDRLLEKPPIAGLTDDLVELSATQRKWLVAYLREHGLLVPAKLAADPLALEMHPLIREFFASRLEESQPKAYRAGHMRLFYFYRRSAPADPKTTTQMRKFYYAVCHGCAAMRFGDALTSVYWPTIKRNEQSYNTRILGAFAADLFVLRYFYFRPWQRLHDGVSSDFRGRIYYETAFDLRAIGRLKESLESMKQSLATHLQLLRRLRLPGTAESSQVLRAWQSAAEIAGDVCLLHAMLGELEKARRRADRGRIYADRSKSAFEQTRARSNLVCALVQMGRLPDAEEVFREAEFICKTFEAGRCSNGAPCPTLGSYWFYQLHLELHAYDELEQLIKKTAATRWAVTGMPELSTALADTALAWVCLKRAGATEWPAHSKQKPEIEADLERAGKLLDGALAHMTEAGTMHHRPRVLLARAAWHRLREDWQAADECLQEVEAIAKRGGMKLFQIDHFLESARLELARGKCDKVAEMLARARDGIAETGYHRREHDLEVLQSALQR